jgi:hypothetical protein
MLSIVLEYLCTGLKCFLECWNAIDRDGSTYVQVWNAFYSVGIALYRVGMLSRGLECFRQVWNTFVQC